MSNKLLTIPNVLKTSAQILLADIIVFLPMYYSLWQVILFTQTDTFVSNFTCVYDRRAIELSVAVFLVVSVLFFGYLVRVNSTCIGKRKTLLDCAYLGVYKSWKMLALCFVLSIGAMFYYAIMHLLFIVTQYVDVQNTLPAFSYFIQDNYSVLVKYGVIFILSLSVIRNPIVFSLSVILDNDVFSVIDKSKKISSSNRMLLLKLLSIPVSLLFLLNYFFTFYTSHLVFFLSMLMIAIIFVLTTVLYHISELGK